LDVHAETIAVAIAQPDGEVRSLGADVPYSPMFRGSYVFNNSL
jgi:hypothetical protein